MIGGHFNLEEFVDQDGNTKISKINSPSWSGVGDPSFNPDSYVEGMLSTSNLNSLRYSDGLPIMPLGYREAKTNEIISKIFKHIMEYAKLSPCQRAKIGCGVVKLAEEYPILILGKNDYPKGFAEDASCHSLGCEPAKTCRLTVHAESDALSQIPNHYDERGYLMFCLAVPCLDCMKLLTQRNVKAVFYLDDRPQPEYDRPAMSLISQNSGIKFIRFRQR